ncbi:EthD family reductase [Rhodococcus sp. NPDC060176]|uniref:EthD family reductase n=1 Tax=Rhodococcus sp. NPDC060176 TaxID=3347062 RepID=UPI00365F0AB5
MVLYGPQEDIHKFREYYEQTHLPIAQTLPGIRSTRLTFDVNTIEGKSPYVAIFEADFDSTDALFAALDSPEGQRAQADLPNYVTGPVLMLHFPSRPAFPTDEA